MAARVSLRSQNQRVAEDAVDPNLRIDQLEPISKRDLGRPAPT